jgi:diguanylate cyclase (GGDEF)-like protein
MFKYPLIYFSTAAAFVAFMRYLDIKIPKYFIAGLWAFFIINLTMALTNQWHLLYIDLPYEETITFKMLAEADTGWFFLVHTIFSYLLLLSTAFMVIKKSYRSLKKEKDAFPFILLVFTVVFGVIINYIHVFYYTFTLDPTHIIFVAFISISYFIFYIRDVRLILELNNNEFVLNNLREMYMIVNHRDEVVDASKSFLDKFSITLDEGLPLKDIMKKIEKTSVVYSSSKNIEYDETKDFIHMKIKDINIPLMKHHGHMILFYDETKIQKYIHDMDYVMNHDLMTDLYNRNYLESVREDYGLKNQYGCVIFDLDGLKLYNDYLGHNEGDRLLKRFANILKDLSDQNPNMIAIRMGGDEFLLILPDMDKNKIESVINQIYAEADDDDPLENIGFSYGYAIREEDQNLSNVMSEADVHMYQMKATRQEAKTKLEETLKKQMKSIE